MSTTDVDSLNPFLGLLASGWQPHADVRGPVIVAVSGGGDSVALLRGLHALLGQAVGSACQELVVAHALHDLRGSQAGQPAAVDAEFVGQLAAELGLPCVVRSLGVREAVRGGEGLEAAARRLRYGFFRDVAEDHGARLVATAHTADDQVETVLHRLLRGTGLAGLSGIAAVRSLVEGIVVVRPMLAISAATARGYLDAVGQPWREDATNRDTRYARNLLRHDLLPRLKAGPYPAVQEAVLRLAEWARQSHEVVEAACEALLAAHALLQPGGSVLLDAKPLASCPSSLLTALAATLWRQQGWPQRDMTSRHYAAVAALVAQDSAPPARLDLPGGIRAEVVASGHLRIGPSGLTPRPDPRLHQ